jgi:hypothetical protein
MLFRPPVHGQCPRKSSLVHPADRPLAPCIRRRDGSI